MSSPRTVVQSNEEAQQQINKQLEWLRWFLLDNKKHIYENAYLTINNKHYSAANLMDAYLKKLLECITSFSASPPDASTQLENLQTAQKQIESIYYVAREAKTNLNLRDTTKSSTNQVAEALVLIRRNIGKLAKTTLDEAYTRKSAPKSVDIEALIDFYRYKATQTLNDRHTPRNLAAEKTHFEHATKNKIRRALKDSFLTLPDGVVAVDPEEDNYYSVDPIKEQSKAKFEGNRSDGSFVFEGDRDEIHQLRQMGLLADSYILSQKMINIIGDEITSVKRHNFIDGASESLTPLQKYSQDLELRVADQYRQLMEVLAEVDVMIFNERDEATINKKLQEKREKITNLITQFKTVDQEADPHKQAVLKDLHDQYTAIEKTIQTNLDALKQATQQANKTFQQDERSEKIDRDTALRSRRDKINKHFKKVLFDLNDQQGALFMTAGRLDSDHLMGLARSNMHTNIQEEINAAIRNHHYHDGHGIDSTFSEEQLSQHLIDKTAKQKLVIHSTKDLARPGIEFNTIFAMAYTAAKSQFHEEEPEFKQLVNKHYRRYLQQATADRGMAAYKAKKTEKTKPFFTDLKTSDYLKLSSEAEAFTTPSQQNADQSVQDAVNEIETAANKALKLLETTHIQYRLQATSDVLEAFPTPAPALEREASNALLPSLLQTINMVWDLFGTMCRRNPFVGTVFLGGLGCAGIGLAASALPALTTLSAKLGASAAKAIAGTQTVTNTLATLLGAEPGLATLILVGIGIPKAAALTLDSAVNDEHTLLKFYEEKWGSLRAVDTANTVGDDLKLQAQQAFQAMKWLTIGFTCALGMGYGALLPKVGAAFKILGGVLGESTLDTLVGSTNILALNVFQGVLKIKTDALIAAKIAGILHFSFSKASFDKNTPIKDWSEKDKIMLMFATLTAQMEVLKSFIGKRDPKGNEYAETHYNDDVKNLIKKFEEGTAIPKLAPVKLDNKTWENFFNELEKNPHLLKGTFSIETLVELKAFTAPDNHDAVKAEARNTLNGFRNSLKDQIKSDKAFFDKIMHGEKTDFTNEDSVILARIFNNYPGLMYLLPPQTAEKINEKLEVDSRVALTADEKKQQLIDYFKSLANPRTRDQLLEDSKSNTLLYMSFKAQCQAMQKYVDTNRHEIAAKLGHPINLLEPFGIKPTTRGYLANPDFPVLRKARQQFTEGHAGSAIRTVFRPVWYVLVSIGKKTVLDILSPPAKIVQRYWNAMQLNKNYSPRVLMGFVLLSATALLTIIAKLTQFIVKGLTGMVAAVGRMTIGIMADGANWVEQKARKLLGLPQEKKREITFDSQPQSKPNKGAWADWADLSERWKTVFVPGSTSKTIGNVISAMIDTTKCLINFIPQAIAVGSDRLKKGLTESTLIRTAFFNPLLKQSSAPAEHQQADAQQSMSSNWNIDRLLSVNSRSSTDTESDVQPIQPISPVSPVSPSSLFSSQRTQKAASAAEESKENSRPSPRGNS